MLSKKFQDSTILWNSLSFQDTNTFYRNGTDFCSKWQGTVYSLSMSSLRLTVNVEILSTVFSCVPLDCPKNPVVGGVFVPHRRVVCTTSPFQFSTSQWREDFSHKNQWSENHHHIPPPRIYAWLPVSVNQTEQKTESNACCKISFNEMFLSSICLNKQRCVCMCLCICLWICTLGHDINFISNLMY